MADLLAARIARWREIAQKAGGQYLACNEAKQFTDAALHETVSVMAFTCADELAADRSALRAQIEQYPRFIEAVLHEYAEDNAPGACDVCEQCGPLVMCSFHGLLSLLSGRTSIQDANGEWLTIPKRSDVLALFEDETAKE